MTVEELQAQVDEFHSLTAHARPERTPEHQEFCHSLFKMLSDSCVLNTPVNLSSEGVWEPIVPGLPID